MSDTFVEAVIGQRVQHNYSRGPASGGPRYSPEVDLDEVCVLAARDVDDVEVRPRRLIAFGF